MEFLIDNNISPKVAESLSHNGFGSVHVKNLG
jgi:predicted nuclease of predicted toxin-antitoxin system